MEKKRGKWLIAVLILVLAAACAGGFYLVKSRSRQEKETADQSTEIVLGENQTLEEVQIKTINGNEMTYEQDGEIVSIRIVQG